MSISFSGLASGLDTSSWVESLVSLKQAKIDSYEEEKDVVAQMQDTLASIKSFFTSFRGVIEKVTDAKFGIASMDIFAQNLATSSNLDVLTASVTSEAEEATYNVGVDQLATATDAVSQYTYTTTIVQTSIASLDSKLINLGLNINDTGSQIGVTVNGVEHGIILYENDTIQDLIDKLQNIGVDASYNEDTGVFSMNISDSDINDIDNTNIVDALHLEGVNEGYTSNNLQIEHVETIYSDATESTLLSELGVNAGLLTIDANDQSYTVTIKNNTTIGSFVADLESKHIDVDFTDGVLTLDNAVISNQGTTNFLDALNMQQDVASQTQTSNNLNFQTITTDTSVATEDTLLKDLGEGINFTNGQTIIFKNSNNVYDTITVNQTTTLGDIIAELNNNGLNAQLSQDGILSIQGGEITGGTFDAINLLNLNETPMTAMASGNSLSHTIEFNSVITANTKIVDEFGAKQGYFLVTDANGNEHYTKIYSGQTFQNLIDTLNSYGISASLSQEGILSVQGGTLQSLTDSQVQQLVSNKTINETNANLIKGSDFVDIVFKNTDFNASEATSDPLTYTLTQTLNASLTTTLAQLGITKNGNINVDGKNIRITTSMSIQNLIDTLAANNIQANWDAQNATLTINAKVQDPNNTNFVNALNLQETVTEYYASSDRIFQAVTNTQQATESTALNQFGITNSLSNAQRTVKFYNANGDLLSQITVTQSSTLSTLISAANKAGLNASLNNGILTIEDGYISNDILQDSLGLEYNPGSSFALGNIITTTELQAATLDSSLNDIIAALGNQSLVASGYTLSFNGTALNVSQNSTINDIINLIQLNGGSASIDSSGRLSISGGTLSGSVANALEITQTITTTKVNATGDKTLMTKQEVFADRSTTLKQLGINTSTMVINKNGAAIKTITVQATNSLGDLFDTLAANGIEASIADGVITLSSLQNLYVSGNLANSLGINTFSNTQTLNTSASSTIAVSYTDTIIADITSKLGDVGAIKNTSDNLLIFDSDNNCIATISSLTTQSSIGDMFALLNNYGFSTNIYNGTISIYSDQGLYIKGNIATNLGINATSTGTVYTTLGNAITSSIQISYSQNDNISLEDKLSNVISITGNNVIQVTNQNGNHIAYITVNQNTTFAQLFNSLNNYGINASLSDNYIDLQSNDNNVIKDSSGNVLSQLGISLSSTTVTTTIGMTSSSSSQIKYSQNVSNPADGSTTMAQLGLTGKTLTINQTSGGTVNMTFAANATLDSLFNTLAAYGINASISNGVISIASTNGNYISGTLPTALGISVINGSTSGTIGQSTSSSGALTAHEGESPANTSNTLAEIGITGNQTLVINQTNGSSNVTITVTDSTTLNSIFNTLSTYGINASMSNGIITLDSESGAYISGSLATALGFDVLSFVANKTTGTSMTSNAPITYTSTGNVIATADTTLGELGMKSSGSGSSSSIPFLKSITRKTKEEAEAAGYIWVTSAAQLNSLMHNTESPTTLIMLGTDIDLSGIEWNPANFNGTFDGNGYTISNLTINEEIKSGSNPNYIGFINYGNIKNVRFENASISVTADYYGANPEIGIISGSGGDIDNCIASGSINVQVTKVTWGYIGGIAGSSVSYDISNSIADVDINVNNNTGSVYVGGIAGYMWFGTISDSHTYSDIVVTGNTSRRFIGGVAGRVMAADSLTISNVVVGGSYTRVNDTSSGGSGIIAGVLEGYAGGPYETLKVQGTYYDSSLADDDWVGYESTDTDDTVTADPTLALSGASIGSYNVGNIHTEAGSGTGNGILDIYSSTGTLVTSLNIEPDDTLQDVFNQLAAYGINASINNGIISLTSTNGNYISGSVPKLLGIETKQITVNTSHAATSTSTAPITATSTNVVTKDATLEQIGISDEISDGFINPINRMTQQEAVAAGYTWVTSASQLQSILSSPSGAYARIMLGADIDLSGISWNSSGLFQGTFDGNGYTISNLSGSAFIARTNGATIRNVKFENANITRDFNSYYGIVTVADQGNSTFENIVIDSSSRISASYTGGTSVAGSTVGSLAASSTIADSVSFASINYSSIFSTDFVAVGGLAGNAQGTITNSVFGGKLNISARNAKVGGIAGWANGTLRNNKSYGQISGRGNNTITGAIAGSVYSSAILASNAYYSTGGLDPFGNRTATSTEAFVNPSILGMGLGFGVFTKDGDLMGEVTVSSSTTLDNIITQLSSYGINATLKNGVLSLSSSSGAVVAGNIPEALGIQLNYNSAAAGGGGTSSGPTTTTTAVSQTSYTDIVTYDGRELNLETLITWLSNNLYDDSPNNYTITVSNSGTTTTIKVNSNDTLGDLQSEFYRAGMSLTLDGKKVTLSSLPTTNAYLVSGPSVLLDALKIGAGEGISYTVTTSGGGGETPDAGPLWSNTDSNTLVGRDLVTTSSSLSDIGVNSTQYITVVQGGTQDVITLDSSASLGDIIDRLSEYGITASLNNQQFTITGNSTGSFVKGMSTSLRNALKLNVGQGYTYNVSSSSQTGNETSGSITTTGTGEVNAKGSTQLSELGINSSQYITIKQNGTTQVVTLGASDSINDLISKLSNYGISASLSNGRIAIEGSEISFVTGMSAGLANALNVTAGKGHSYTISTETVTSNSTTSLQFYTQGASKAVSTSTTLGELGISGTSSMTINQGALGAATVQFTESDTIGDIIEQINLLGGGHLTASLSSNKFNITADGTDYYVSFLSSKLSDALKLGATYKTSTVSKPTNSTTSNYLSVTKNETITATAATSLSSIGVTSNQYITVRQDGTLRTITVGASDTIGSLISKLAKYGINASISDGFLTVQGSENSSITGISSTLANAIKLSASGSGNSYTVITETTYKNSDSKNLGSIASTKTLNSDTTMSQLGFNSSGNITVVQNGTQYQVAVDGSKTLGDILTALSAYGIAGSIQNGKLTLSPSSNAFILGMTSGVATALALKTGKGNSYSTSSKQTYTNSTSKNLNKNGTNLILNEDTVLNKINGFTKAGNLVIHQDNGSNVTISIAATQTLKDFFNQIAAYGLTGNVDSTGRVTISASGNTYLQAVSGGTNLLSALKLSNPTRSTVSEYDNSDSSQLSYTQTIAAQNSTTLQNLIDSSNNKPTFNGNNITLVVQTTANGTTANNTLVFSKTQTLQDVFNTLQNYGIQAQIDASGKISLSSDSLSNFNLSGNLSSFLLGSYSKQYTTQVTNNQSAILTNTVISAMTDDNTLAELGITNGTVNIFKNGQNAGSFNLNTIKTIGDFRNILEQYGFTTSLDNQGRLSVSSADGNYLTASSSNILTKLGLNDFTILDANQQSSNLTQTTVSNPTISLNATLKDLTNSAGTNLGITNGNVYVYNNGVRNTVYIDNNMTLQELSDKLEQFNINLSLADGKIYLEGIGNSYITTDGLSSASNILDKIGLDNWEYEATSTSKPLSFVQSSDQIITENIKITDLQDKNGNKLNISQGTFNIYQNGVKHTETIDSETTVNDLFNMLEKYGINASIASNGAISLSATGNAYIENGSSNIASKLFDDWKFSNTYTSNTLSITQTDTVFIDQNTKLADINEGTFTPGVFTLVNNGVQTNITVNANDTIGTFIDQLQMHGFDTVINENGQLIVQAQGDSYLKNYNGTNASNILDILGLNQSDWINTSTYDSNTLNVIKTNTFDTAATLDTKLSLLGVTTGEYYIYNNGVKYTALISSDETIQSLIDTLHQFGIETSLTGDSSSSILTILGQGDSYIQTSNSATNASNVVDVLFNNSTDTKYQYSSDKQTSEIVTTYSNATEDTLLSYFDTPWGGSTLKAEGQLSVTVNGVDSVINITKDETIGSLLNKFKALGLEATLSDGQIMIQSGYDTFTINSAGTTSSIINPNANFNLKFNDDLGGYLASVDTVMATTTTVEVRTLSVANYADNNTKLGDLNISSGTLSIYRNGQKATIQVDENDTFNQFRAKLASAFSDVDIKFEDGFLQIYSKDGNKIEAGATTDSSNFSAVTGITNQEDGSVKSARALFKVNNESVITNSGLFRNGNVTQGTFTIGNATFTIDNSTTLNDIISQINNNDDANATAYWDNIDGKLVIQSRTTGAAYINIEAGTSNFTDIMGFTSSEWNADGSIKLTRLLADAQDIGQNARFSINGTNYTSTSNTITSDVSRINGLTINLKGLSEGETVTLTIEKDKETVASALQDVVDSYNELMKNVDEAIAANGDLHSETTLKLIRNQLRNMMTSSDIGTTVFRNLDAIGICVDAASANNIDTNNIINLSFDKDKFLEAYEADDEAVKALLVGSENNTGIFNKVEQLLESALTSVSGYFDSADRSFDREIERLDNKIVNATKDMQRYRERLENKFSAMDMLIANMQQQYASFLV